MLSVQVLQSHHSLQLNDSRNLHFGRAVLHISFTDLVSYILLSQLCQLVNLPLGRAMSHHALLYRFRHCAHHPARFIISAQLALLGVFVILIFHILPIVGTCKITKNVSDSYHDLLKSVFGFSVRQSRDFSMLGIFLLLLNHCLCVFNSVYCPNGFSLNIILNPFHILFIG